MRLRICELVINDNFINKQQIKNVLSLKKNAIQDYAYILHDKDFYNDNKLAKQQNKKIGDLKTPHYHICLRFKTPQDTKHISQWFNVAEQFVGKIKGRFADALQYLTHKNRPDKFQYSDDEVTSNFDWKSETDSHLFLKKYKIDPRLKEILEKIAIGEFKEYNITKHISILENNIYSASIEKAFKYRANTLKGIERKMDCIFITGISGVGKTTLAKEIANNKHYSVYISSGSNDILDDYQGQECIILDDLRPECLGLSDLLKMLDNNTASSVKSRYKNKVLECKLIIITTTLPIDKFFIDVFKSKETQETIIQLQRRCQLHIKIDSNYIRYNVWDDKLKKYGQEFKEKNNLLDKFQLKSLNEKEQKEFIKNLTNRII